MFSFLQSHARWLGSFGLGATTGLDLVLTHQDQLNQLIGAIIVVVTVVGGFIHDYELKNAQIAAKTPAAQPSPVTVVQASAA